MNTQLTMASLTRDQKDAIYSLAKDIADGMVVRIHRIMLLAMADEFGIGKKRMDRFITRYRQYIDAQIVTVTDGRTEQKNAQK